MKIFKLIINIIIGTLISFFSIALIAFELDAPFLFGAGFIIAPATIIYINKKINIKPKKYYLSLVVMLFISIVFSMVSMQLGTSNDNVVKNQQIIATGKNDEDAASKKQDTTSDNIEKEPTSTETNKDTANKDTEDIFAGYKLIEVEGGNLSGHREPSVVVDIGFGDREYYAFTNEYGQLVKVVAKEIILQDDSKEPVNSKGRYYNDEAKVPGVESKDLDEGHVIADSLGGVSNAYNITPQNSTLNRNGDQAYMEKVIRDAGGCRDFVAIITYPNTTTQIPSHYSYTYTLKGNVINDEFDNVNPDEVNANLGITGQATNDNTNNDISANNSSNNDTSTNNNNANTGGTTTTGTVYWTPNGKSYHTTKGCSTLSRSKTILSGTQAESGKSDPCDKCH